MIWGVPVVMLILSSTAPGHVPRRPLHLDNKRFIISVDLTVSMLVVRHAVFYGMITRRAKKGLLEDLCERLFRNMCSVRNQDQHRCKSQLTI